MPRLIAFFGPDGTGKTTQVNLLVNYCQSNSDKVKRVWIRSPHTLAYLASCFLIKIGFCRAVLNSFGNEKLYPFVYSSRLLSFFWSLLELISVIPLILIRIYIPLLFGYTVIAERYVVDTVVTIAYYTRDLEFIKGFVARILLSFIPKNSLLIHLDSDYSTLMMRRNSLVEAYDFIEFQRKGYNLIGKLIRAPYIDTSKSTIEQTFLQIVNVLR